jgi:KUP system potassium uptake protein
MITPAISVLSAVEGLRIVSPTVTPYVVPIAAIVLVCLFSIQSRGSGAVGFLFGPVMAIWFATLAVAGLIHLVHYPRVLLALSPNYALAYAGHVGAGTTFAVLGSVFLALTGGEALYADMGHFGRSAIRISGGGGKSLFPPVSELALGACNSADDSCDRDCESGRTVWRLRSRSASHSTWGYPAA